MTCKKCEEYQGYGMETAYYRWGTANVGFLGCSQHLKEIFDAPNEKQKKK